MLGLSQHDLGEAVNVSIQQIQKYEKGQNKISITRLIEISKALNTDLIAFFSEEREFFSEENSQNYKLEEEQEKFLSFNENKITNKEILNIARAYSSIPDQIVRKRLLLLAKSLKT